MGPSSVPSFGSPDVSAAGAAGPSTGGASGTRRHAAADTVTGNAHPRHAGGDFKRKREKNPMTKPIKAAISSLVAASVAGLIISSSIPASAAVVERLPDLKMLKPTGFYIQNTT